MWISAILVHIVIIPDGHQINQLQMGELSNHTVHLVVEDCQCLMAWKTKGYIEEANLTPTPKNEIVISSMHIKSQKNDNET